MPVFERRPFGSRRVKPYEISDGDYLLACLASDDPVSASRRASRLLLVFVGISAGLTVILLTYGVLMNCVVAGQ